jgi:hypothetical protein
MSENDVAVAVLCLASPFCVVAGLLSGLLWRLHLVLGTVATLATVWFLAMGLMPIMLLPTVSAAMLWTAIGAGVAKLLGGYSRFEDHQILAGNSLRPERETRGLSQGAL